MSETPDLNYREQFEHNLPTLYSQSPPPIQENSDDDDEDENNKQSLDLNNHHLSHSLASSNSNSSIPKLNMPSPSRESSPQPQDINMLNSLNKEWDNDFTPFNNDNQEDTDSGWANLEPSFSSNSNAICTNDLTTDINQLNKSDNDSKPTENNDEDDDWGDFVEIEQTTSVENNNTSLDNQQIETVSTNLIDYDLIINELFKSNNVKISNDEYNDLIVNNLVIETDDLWKQIQTFTTVTDASNSLQFKWCLSNLEDNYLNALNLERIVVKANRTLSPQAILQPVKAEPLTTKPLVDETKVEIKNSTDLNTSDLLTAPPLNLDLSFFESKEIVNINTNNSNSKSNLKQQNSNSNSKPDSKVYLDKLLEEIFTNDTATKKSKSLNKENNNQQQSDDLFTDKKSLSSSSSSSSSSNINELNPSTSSNHSTSSILQLQPHLLEIQQMQNNREYDEKALNLVSKLSNLTFKNSKVVVLPR